MFRRLREDGRRIALRVDGHTIEARAGDSVAAAMLAAGMTRMRVTAGLEAPRGPHCLVGACFDCLVSIDGVGNRRACMVEAAEGMDVRTEGRRRGLPR